MTVILSHQKKSNSDRPLNPKNHDRLSQNQTAIAPSTAKITIATSKIKQRSRIV
jgi:hypothetical protein